MQEVEDALADLLLVRGARAELCEVLQAECRLEPGAAVGGDLVDDVLDAGDVVGFVDEQRHAGALALGEVDLALHLGVEHPQQEDHACLAVLLTQHGHVRVDDEDVPRLDDLAQRDVGRVVEEPPQRWLLEQEADLVARRVEPLGGRAARPVEFVGQLVAVERGGLVEVGLVRARLGDGLPEVLLGGEQQVVDILELGPALLALREGDRTDNRMVEVPAARHEDLVLVDIQQRGNDVVSDRSGLHRQRPVAGQSQRIHPERRSAQVEEPHPLGAIRGGRPQTDVGELALGIDHDRGGVGRHDVVGVKRDQG